MAQKAKPKMGPNEGDTTMDRGTTTKFTAPAVPGGRQQAQVGTGKSTPTNIPQDHVRRAPKSSQLR